MGFAVGAKLGSVEVLGIIGRGGMGEVYRALDTKLKREVAIKTLPDEFLHDADRLSRFQREAEVLASLNHPNIAAIYDIEEADGARFLVLELVEGETLADRIARGPIPIDEALQIAKSICEALEAAHEQGIVHRDLKPANIKITSDGKVKVLDFGLAKAMEPSPPTTLSNSPTLLSAAASNAGVILGTPAYMSPEQAKGQELDRRTDIFSFGCVLYEMLTGKPAFSGDSVTQILARVLERDPDWTFLPSNLPARSFELLQLCLQKDLRKRRSDAADVRIDIEQALNHLDETDRHPSIALLRRDRAGWILAAIFFIMIAALIMPALRYFRGAPPAPEMQVEITTPATPASLEFALSPDGKRLAFVALDKGRQRLWIRSLDAAAAQPIPGTDDAGLPFWSPDGRSIGFFDGSRLKRIDVDGGTPQILAPVPGGVAGGTWNRDGVILFASTNALPIWRTPATGGDPVAVTHVKEGETGHHSPYFLPDGTHFLYVATPPSRTGGDIYLASLDGGDPKRVVSGEAVAWMPPASLLYTQQGILRLQAFDTLRGTLSGNPVTIADRIGYDGGRYRSGFSASAAGLIAYRSVTGLRTQLTWFDRAGKIVGTTGPAEENTSLAIGVGYPELSPDGRIIAMDSAVTGVAHVWLVDLARGGPTRFTFEAVSENHAVWSPDGKQIVFRKQPTDLYVKAADGAGAEQLLLKSAYLKTPFSWSPDGRFILYNENNANGPSDMWALPLQGDRKPLLIVKSPFRKGNGQFSPDGRWIAYQSEESGRWEIYVVPFPPGGGKWQVSTAGGSAPRWSHDGKELFFIAPDEKMMAASVSASGSSFQTASPVALFQTNIVGGSGAIQKQQYTVSADGRFLINVPAGDFAVTPITLILNWKPKQ